MCNVNRTASFMHSREGVMQGGPLAMIAYGISILPLIDNLKRGIPDTTQSWYTDNHKALGMFVIIETYFNSLILQGLGRGYYNKPFKSLPIVHPENLEAIKVPDARHGLKVCTGARYLRGYIGANESERDWLRELTLTW